MKELSSFVMTSDITSTPSRVNDISPLHAATSSKKDFLSSFGPIFYSSKDNSATAVTPLPQMILMHTARNHRNENGQWGDPRLSFPNEYVCLIAYQQVEISTHKFTLS
mmetsp:Transcript_43061/g.131136  ORF Transcript_43061/g.131136 Transcript_43061/m.131136 type:complete len:108 (-) Transcript_43061:38-361(-)